MPAPPPPPTMPPTALTPRPRHAAGGAAALVIGIGAILIIANVILQFVRLSVGGLSESAAEVNGVCQSALGQLGQAISSRLGYGVPQALCGRAAAIEDWKAVTLWLGIVLIAVGLVLIARRAGWVSAASVRPRPGQ